MTPDFACMIYLAFLMQLKTRTKKERLNSRLTQVQLNEAKHQLYLAISKSQRGLHQGF